LGNTPDAYGQVWHLPTSEEKLTGRDFIGLFAEAMNKPAKFMSIPTPLIRTIGIFNSLFRELGEMMYQFDRDYFFNSSKFRTRFPSFTTTSYAQGVRASSREGQ
jgi:hypothetical protein